MFDLIWSPVNQAWLVLFGTGHVSTRSVLRIFNDKQDAIEEMRDWGVDVSQWEES